MDFGMPDLTGLADRDKHLLALDMLHVTMMTMNALDTVGGVDYAGGDTHVDTDELRPHAALSLALDTAVEALVRDEDRREELREALCDSTDSARGVLARLESDWYAGDAADNGRRVAQAYTALLMTHGGKVDRPAVPDRFSTPVLAKAWKSAFDHEVRQDYLDRN